jgi:thiamine kinase-like enzyme
MAREKDRKRWSDEDTLTGKTGEVTAGNGSVEKFEELMNRAEPLLEQINSLYKQYITGVESLPPTQRRQQLDQIMFTLQAMPKPNATYRFRFSSLNATYVSFKDRWERMIRDLESGKIKRITGPKRGT